MSGSLETISRYAEGLRCAYLGELAAEQVYRALAHNCQDPVQRQKFAAIADVEQLTAATLQPLARRAGLSIAAAELQARVEQRLAQLQTLPWPQFVEQAASGWPRYIAEFEQLAAQAPPQDADAIRLLIAHERALVHFIEIERQSPGSTRSLEPLKALLALMPRPAATGRDR